MITKSLEDYIEYIYTSLSNGEELKAIDITKKFNISRASVSEALIRLCELGLVIYEGRKGIIVTEKVSKKVGIKDIKERKPELIDLGMYTDDIATVALLSGLKWIEPSLPFLYSISGYKSGIGYRN